MIAALLLVSVLLTATLSGVFGMGGGMILMGVLAALVPLRTAMLVHGIVQLSANGSRALFLRRHIRFSIVGWVAVGATVALGLLTWLQLRLEVGGVYLVLGTLPLLALAMPKPVKLSVESPPQAIACGALFSGLQLVAGASGPILDAFFLRGTLTRFEIVATKATIGALGHILKLLYWGFLLREVGAAGVPWALVVPSIGLALVGTRFGKSLLSRLREVHFHRYSRILIATVAAIYLARGLF